MPDPISLILKTYSEYITNSCKENGCGFSLNGIPLNRRAIIHGSKYQKENGFDEKLCDRLVFCQHSGLLLSAVELKGGKNVHVGQAIQQIQNGLTLAMELLDGRQVSDWYPLLFYSGHMSPLATNLLRTKTVSFQHVRKSVIKRNCNTELRLNFED